MNELMRELSLQASDSIPDDVSAEYALYLFQKKFAELIVRECANQCLSDDSMRILNHMGMKGVEE